MANPSDAGCKSDIQKVAPVVGKSVSHSCLLSSHLRP
jgi:hypothetical protein